VAKWRNHLPNITRIFDINKDVIENLLYKLTLFCRQRKTDTLSAASGSNFESMFGLQYSSASVLQKENWNSSGSSWQARD